MTKTSRGEIVKAARDLMRARGYAATSMKDVGDRVGLLKGSLYAHFRNKEEMVPEILALALAEMTDEAESDGNWRKDYVRTVDRLVRLLRDNKRCVGFHLAYNLDAEAEVARNAVVAFFHALREHIASILDLGLGKEAAWLLATDTITVLEGATLWLALDGDEQPIDRARDALLARIPKPDDEEPDAEVCRLLDRVMGDWRLANATERTLAARVVSTEADFLNVRAALAGQIEAESCFR